MRFTARSTRTKLTRALRRDLACQEVPGLLNDHNNPKGLLQGRRFGSDYSSDTSKVTIRRGKTDEKSRTNTILFAPSYQALMCLYVIYSSMYI